MKAFRSSKSFIGYTKDDFISDLMGLGWQREAADLEWERLQEVAQETLPELDDPDNLD